MTESAKPLFLALKVRTAASKTSRVVETLSRAQFILMSHRAYNVDLPLMARADPICRMDGQTETSTTSPFSWEMSNLLCLGKFPGVMGHRHPETAELRMTMG